MLQGLDWRQRWVRPSLVGNQRGWNPGRCGQGGEIGAMAQQRMDLFNRWRAIFIVQGAAPSFTAEKRSRSLQSACRLCAESVQYSLAKFCVCWLKKIIIYSSQQAPSGTVEGSEVKATGSVNVHHPTGW